ncbi:MAG: hypothetical protein ABSC92_17795 [Rhizomicrobium sp.]
MFLRFRPSGIAVSLLCAIAATPVCAANAQTPTVSRPSSFALTVSFPTDVTINHMSSDAGGQILPEDVQLTLANNSSVTVMLEEANDCITHFWTVTDADGNTIDDRAVCPTNFAPVQQPLAAHGTFTATEPVPLNSSKYRDGGHYTLHYTFWGVKGTAQFTTHEAE